MYKQPPKYTVIKDTREQQGYFFNPYQSCAGMIDRKLDTGDYSILGLEDKICIERKATPTELALNLGSNKSTFMREINRMQDYEHKFLILEFGLDDLADFPNNSSIPEVKRKSIKVTGKYITKCLMEFMIYDDIQVIFCNNKHNAFLMVSSLLKRLNEMYTVGRQK